MRQLYPLSVQTQNTIQSKGKAAKKVADYQVFLKVRLASLVVFSATITYVLAAKSAFAFDQLLWVVIGGFLVTGASNGFNQIWEKETDKLMSRTQDRPLPQDRMKVTEGIVLAIITGVLGVFVLWYYLNPMR